MTDGRSRILERRARFILAAMTLGASGGALACGPTVCLEPSIDCDADTPQLMVVGPTGTCVGDPVTLQAVLQGSCGTRDVTAQTVFATSDPEALAFEGAKGRASKAGKVVVTALFEGRQATLTIDITSCEKPADAGAD